MPTLNDYVFNPEEPMNVVARQVLERLRGVSDQNGSEINQSVEFGLDSVLWDVMYGGLNSSDTLFPMIRAWYGTHQREVDDGYVGVAFTTVPLYLYFLYYVGVPSQDATRVSFVEQRENHIRANIDALRMDRCVPRTDATGGDIWRWVPQTIVEDHDTPFKYLDSQVQLNTQYACSRVDLTFRVKGSLLYPLN